MLSLRSLTKLLRVFVQQPTVSLHRSIPFTWAEPLWARATYYSARTASSPHVRLVDSTVKGVNVQWGEGDQAQQDYFHGVWLRHNCHCPLCVDQSANQNIIDSTQLDNPSVAHVAVNGNNMELTWRIGVEEHKGYIPLQFLKENHYSDETLTDSKQSRHDEMVTAKMNQIPKICTNNILSSDEELWRWLWNLSEYGMCIINNVPTVPGAAIPLAERISYIQETLYGRILDVVASEKPIDLAYGMGSLPLHSDLVMYESPPGILMLHCIKNDAIGGETLLLDTFPVLEEMRIKHPEEFDTLTRVPATFQRIVHFDRKSPAHIVGQKPHIVLGENEEIVAVNWNQRACGPLKIPSADIEPYYKAYVLLAKLFESSERVHQFRLLPGQVLSINNRRILHGRNAFQGSSRHLQEIFVSTDEFKSRFLVLDAIYGNGSTKKLPAHIVGQKPHIVLGENEEIVAVDWNQRARGPLKIPSADIEPYYKAYVLLAKLFESSERVHQFRLLPGQVLSINNRRILHGRNAFQGSSQHLQEIFVSTDEFKSRFLVLDAIYGNGSTK